MDLKTFRELERIFNLAIKIEPHKRSEFVRLKCKGDSELEKKILAMLDADSTEDKISSIVKASAQKIVSQVDPWLGRIVGNYKITNLIANGGMGNVYLGERINADYNQKVAIKLMSQGLLSDKARERFIIEQQILANLNHTNIAKLLDGGATEQGVLYLVMEFIDGQAIDEFCDQHKLSVNERLNKLLTVASALQYAHSNLIVHRDIKPSNVLVEKDGTVKLIDFGIAKVLDEDLLENNNSITQTEHRLLTPESASPEQVLGETVSTATDVYGLGILAFRLLTGNYPFVATEKANQDLQRIICEQEAQKLSLVVRKNNSQQVAESRSTTTLKLVQELKGDLDTIFLRCLRKKPQNRYATAKELSEDIRNYLQQRPITARPPAFGYHLSKFILRNRLSVSSVLLGVIALSAQLTYSTIRIASERDLAIASQKKAIMEAEHSAATTQFLVSLFENANPSVNGIPSTTAEDLLNQGLKRIEIEIPENSISKARMLHSMGLAYKGLDQNSKAITVLTSSYQIYSKLLGKESIEAAEALHRLGDAYRETGRSEKGLEMLLEALEIRQQAFRGDHLDIADSYNNIAMALRNLGKYKEAFKYQKDAIDMSRRIDKDASIHILLNNLSLLYEDMRDVPNAIKLGDEAAENYRLHRKNNNYGAIISIQLNRAMLKSRSGDYQGAIISITDALEKTKLAFPETQPRVIFLKREMAQAYHGLKNYEKANQIFSEAVDLCMKACTSKTHLPITLKYWALMLKDWGKHAEAISMINRSITGYETHYRATSYSTIRAKINRAEIFLDTGEFEAFKKQIDEIESFMAKHPPRNPSHRHNTNILIAESLLMSNRSQKALELLNPAIVYHSNNFGVKSKMYLRASKLKHKILNQLNPKF